MTEKKQSEIVRIASRDQGAIDIWNGRQQVGAFTGNGDRKLYIWKAFTQSCYDGRRQNQVADSLELEEENFHEFRTVLPLCERWQRRRS